MVLVRPEIERQRRTGPEAQVFEERLASLRYKIRATAAYERLAARDLLVAGGGGEFGKKFLAVTVEHRRALLGEWLRVASCKMRLHLGIVMMPSEDPLLEPMMQPSPEEGTTARRSPRWHEAQELEKRMACLAEQIFATQSDCRFLREYGHLNDPSRSPEGGGGRQRLFWFEEEFQFLAEDAPRSRGGRQRLIWFDEFQFLAQEAQGSLVQEWLHLASFVYPSIMSSESEQAAEPWQEEGRRPTWQEAQALQNRVSSLRQQVDAAAANMLMAKELLAKGAVDEMLAGNIRARHRALARAYVRLASSVRDPDFSGMSEADRAAEAERLRQEKLGEARRLLYEAGDIYRCRLLEANARILDFDPKQLDGIYLNSVSCVDLSTFDHSHESPVGPMRFTDSVYKDEEMVKVNCVGVNIISIKIDSSDIGFPIQLYGTVFARDCIDLKRVYLFRRDSNHCQLINSKEEALILTGPKRGLQLSGDAFVETDLWVKDHQGHCREFSKGLSTIRGIVGRPRGKQICVDERVSLDTRLSTVDVLYQVVGCAVEATIAVEVLQGEIDGVITAHTTTSESCILLYDSSQVAGVSCHGGVIQLMRAAISVYVKGELMILAKAAAGDGKYIKFTPMVNGGDEIVSTLGDTTLCVKVAWSLIVP